MSVKMTGTLFDFVHCEITHEPSDKKAATTPPVDNGGDGSSFSPTDMCAASLVTCAATTMGLFAKRNNIDLKKVQFSVEKEMASEPRRIGSLKMMFEIQSSCSEGDFQKLVHAAKTCPVMMSLSPQIQIQDSYTRKN